MATKLTRRGFVAACASVVIALTGCGATTPAPEATGTTAQSVAAAEPTTVRVASLKGPTSMGLVQFMDQANSGSTTNSYEFTISGTADEVVPKVISGDVDIALVPANVASVLYNKTKGAVEVLDVNALGVLNVVTADESVQKFSDLAGKTVYMTGKGATPEYAMDYLLKQAGIADSVTLEFKSEATEVVSALASDPTAVGVLPEPYKTAAMAKNDKLKSPISLTDVWAELAGGTGSQLLTGVTIVRREFADEHPEAVWEFVDGQSASVKAVKSDPGTWAQAIVDAGIVDNAAIAQKAIPGSNLSCLTGDEMRSALSGYLQVLYDADASSVGGALPGDDFYYAVQGA